MKTIFTKFQIILLKCFIFIKYFLEKYLKIIGRCFFLDLGENDEIFGNIVIYRPEMFTLALTAVPIRAHH
jgi:hypothetical protein